MMNVFATLSMVRELTTYVAVAAALGFAYLVGSISIGSKREGGKRAVILTLGVGAVWIGAIIFADFQSEVAQPTPVAILVGILSLVFVPTGLALATISLFGSCDLVRSCFATIFRSL